MRTAALFPVLALSLLSGCATTSFLGLAKTSYVDQKTQANRQEILQRLEALQGQVEQITEVTGDLKALVRDIAETKQATEKLQELAKQVEGRFQEIPRETLRELMELIRRYLEEGP